MTAAAKAKEIRRMQKRRSMQKARASGPDLGPDERYNHGKVQIVEHIAAGMRVAKDQWCRQIDQLNERGRITDRQWHAAEQLYQDWLASHHVKAVTGGYDGGCGGSKGRKGGKRQTEVVPHTRPFMAYTEALRALPRYVANIVRSVVVEDNAPTQATPELSMRSHIHSRGTRLLCEGLDILADHYGLEREKI